MDERGLRESGSGSRVCFAHSERQKLSEACFGRAFASAVKAGKDSGVGQRKICSKNINNRDQTPWPGNEERGRETLSLALDIPLFNALNGVNI